MTNDTSTSVSRQVGRPREFDMEAALDAVLLVFRERGYNGTSINNLCDATGLTAGSLYKAFKDKRGIFMAALDRYIEVRNAALSRWLAPAKTGREKIIATLGCYAEASSEREGQRGCLVVGGLTDISTFDERTAQRFRDALSRIERLFADFLQLGIDDGSLLPEKLNVSATARYLLCVVEGLRVLGKAGANDADTAVIIEQAIRVLG